MFFLLAQIVLHLFIFFKFGSSYFPTFGQLIHWPNKKNKKKRWTQAFVFALLRRSKREEKHVSNCWKCVVIRCANELCLITFQPAAFHQPVATTIDSRQFLFVFDRPVSHHLPWLHTVAYICSTFLFLCRHPRENSIIFLITLKVVVCLQTNQ